MKNKIVLITLFLAMTYCVGQNNSGEVIYRKEIITNLSDSEKGVRLQKESPDLYKRMLMIENNSRFILDELRFQLVFVDAKSLFEVKEFLESENNKFYKSALGPLGSAIYYTDINRKEVLILKEAYGETFLINSPKIEWEISNEIKVISNYTCYLATAIKEVKGRKGIIRYNVRAWYCPELTFSFGPIGYDGLPGLILELEINNEKYTAVKIKLNTKKDLKIEKPKNGKEVTKDEFEEIGLKTMNNFKKSIGK